MYTTKSESTEIRDRRRKHSDEFKAAVAAECRRPGVSIARVALRHGLNANLLRRWVVSAERDAAPIAAVSSESAERNIVDSTPPQFMAVPIAAPGPAATGELSIEIELRRGPLLVKVSWPMTASAECGAWLREWLR